MSSKKKKLKSVKTMSPDSIWNREMFDDLHFTWDDMLGCKNKTWLFGVSEREGGKSTDSWVKIFNAFYYRNRPSLVLRRRIADITSVYVDDIATLLNKFLKPEYHIQLVYLKGELDSGIANVYIGQAGETYSWQAIKKLPIFFRIVALSCPMNRIKSMILRNVMYMFYDEFLANVRSNEKYLSGDEHFLINEIYTTYNREASTPIRILAAGNPYSVYCPLFTGLKVDSSKLKPGAYVVGPNYIVNCFKNPPELKEKLLKQNPLYQFDDAYARYAFDGQAINDANIRIHKTEPRAFKLLYVFKLGNDFISIHRGSSYKDKEGIAKFWVCSHHSDWLAKVSKRRKIIVFSFGDLIDGAIKWSLEQRGLLTNLKLAMNKREIIFNSINASYMLEDISVYF